MLDGWWLGRLERPAVFSASEVGSGGMCRWSERGDEPRLAQTEETPIDAELQRVADAWPTLPEAIRRAVLALVGSADG